MSWFSKEQTHQCVLKPIRKCSCGAMSYGFLRSNDAVHCNECGAMYLILWVKNPVAKFENERIK